MTSELYGDNHRALQREFDTDRLADRIEERLVHDRINADDKAFIESLDMFFLASVDAKGQPSCSYKGGAPGFVRVLHPKTLMFPIYDGNGMFLSMGNACDNPAIGMLFIDFENRRRLRLFGLAQVAAARAADPPYAEAQFVVKVAVTQVFPNCPRYIHKMMRVESSPFVPQASAATPVPGWKRMEWACDVLAKNDPARG
jgi:uncharacterized protein